jgi:rRNA maturation endonuclease Nob1
MESGGDDPGRLVCGHCGRAWYSAHHLSSDEETCPDCGGPLEKPDAGPPPPAA